MFDENRARQHLEDFYGNLPHPEAPDVLVKDYGAYARIATMMKGGFPVPGDVSAAYHQLQSLKIAPAEFEYVWNLAKPISTRLLGRNRNPDVMEIARLAHAHPAEIHDYYHHLPHPQYPEVRAGEVMRYYHAAKPICESHCQRDPVLHEVVRFAMAGYSDDDIHRHYHNGQEHGQRSR